MGRNGIATMLLLSSLQSGRLDLMPQLQAIVSIAVRYALSQQSMMSCRFKIEHVPMPCGPFRRK